MNTKKFLFTLSLVSIILSGCSKSDPNWNIPTENYGTGGSGNTGNPPGGTGNPPTRNAQVIPLNPIETKLSGPEWELKSLTIIDSIYSDSSFVSGKFIQFSDMGYTDRLIPLYTENSLHMVDYMVFNGMYYSPDITHIRIISTSIFSTPDSSLLKIILLTPTELILKDSISNRQWNFVR